MRSKPLAKTASSVARAATWISFSNSRSASCGDRYLTHPSLSTHSAILLFDSPCLTPSARVESDAVSYSSLAAASAASSKAPWTSHDRPNRGDACVVSSEGTAGQILRPGSPDRRRVRWCSGLARLATASSSVAATRACRPQGWHETAYSITAAENQPEPELSEPTMPSVAAERHD